MTKIAISPNVSGTGTFTIAAPNSNDDRTFTLPDATGEVLTDQSDIEAQVKTATNASGSAPVYACRAWVNFDGTLTSGNIRASGNVSSVVRNGTGNYTVNFTTAMPDANYAPIALCKSATGSDIISPGIDKLTNLSTSSFRLRTSESTAGGSENPDVVAVAVFR